MKASADSTINPFPNNKLHSSKLKEIANDNFKCDENGRKFSKKVENIGKRGSCSPSVFRRLILQTRKNMALFGKGLMSQNLKSQQGHEENVEKRKNGGYQHFFLFPHFQTASFLGSLKVWTV